jgi:hypothetical protein
MPKEGKSPTQLIRYLESDVSDLYKDILLLYEVIAIRRTANPLKIG